jgi:heparin/heparan-sulfate lyase
MRRFEYHSPRHNQGVSYAAYRFGWEMHAAWLFRRMTEREVFDPNIKTVPLYWLNMRLPNGEMLRDGDGIPSGRYYSYAQTALLCYAYNNDPLLKGVFLRQGGKAADPLLYLLLNDPALRAEPDLTTLPLTTDFGPVLSGMITRTDWNMGSNASHTVVAEIKGGGYHFGNHQHADAGAIQLYYRGLQVADLGQYKFYGTPYDLNFNKRSVAHSMVLAVDPGETFLKTPANDGGSRFLQTHPRTPLQLQDTPLFNTVANCHAGSAPQPCALRTVTTPPIFAPPTRRNRRVRAVFLFPQPRQARPPRVRDRAGRHPHRRSRLQEILADQHAATAAPHHRRRPASQRCERCYGTGRCLSASSRSRRPDT